MTRGISAMQMVAAAKARIENLSPDRVAIEMQDQGTLLFDLREDNERVRQGILPGAHHLPRGTLEFLADPSSPQHWDQLDPDARIILYCSNGERSALATETLLKMGFQNIAHLNGGFACWVEQGLPIQGGNHEKRH